MIFPGEWETAGWGSRCHGWEFDVPYRYPTPVIQPELSYEKSTVQVLYLLFSIAWCCPPLKVLGLTYQSSREKRT